jgi:hypothetical protein
MSAAPILLRGARVTLRLVLPQTPGEAALILIEQMAIAIEAGQVTVAPQHQAAVEAWLAAARAELKREAAGR